MTDQPQAADGGEQDPIHFRFFDNREKYLLFVTTCSEKWEVSRRLGQELEHLNPEPPALRLFDAGMGDATVLSLLMRHMHRKFENIPWLIVAKEISFEDVRLSLEKLSDRFAEHPELVMVITNLHYGEAPSLRPRSKDAQSRMNWREIPLQGSTSHEFDEQLRALEPELLEAWRVTTSPTTGNPLYVTPSVIILYREDQRFLLDNVIPRQGEVPEGYDLMIASQPYRASSPAATKVKNVLGPLAKSLAPGGRMVTVQSSGNDPAMDIIHKIWPDENPFITPRQALLDEAEKQLTEAGITDLIYHRVPDEEALFQYRLHMLPTQIGESSIGTSTLLAAWNAAVYVAQIEDYRLHEAMTTPRYLEATGEVLQEYGGLWFNDECFVIERKRS